MRLAFRSLKTWNILDPHQFADAKVALTEQRNVRIARFVLCLSTKEPRSQIKHGLAKSILIDQLQQKFLKLQREVKRTEPLRVLNDESHLKTFLPKMGAF